MDWQRITDIEPKIKMLCARHAAPAERDDLAQDIVTELAGSPDSFFDNTDSYIVTGAFWRVVDKRRRLLARDAAYIAERLPDDDDLVREDDTGACIGAKLARFIGDLDAADRELLAGVQRADPARVVKRSGRLHVSRLADELGQPERTVNQRVNVMRRAWSARYVESDSQSDSPMGLCS